MWTPVSADFVIRGELQISHGYRGPTLTVILKWVTASLAIGGELLMMHHDQGRQVVHLHIH